jgi:hypothetical protein
MTVPQPFQYQGSKRALVVPLILRNFILALRRTAC